MDKNDKSSSEVLTVPTYIDIQAEVGISKHFGGFSASEKLYKLCHLDIAEEVLDVGCGAGIGPIHIAKLFGCRVMAVDLSDKMLWWAEKRARRAGVNHAITFRKADIVNLPFKDASFDAVIVESVLSFVEDKEKAIKEIIRVTKPGGHIGINESFWRDSIPTEVTEKSNYSTINIAMESDLQRLWEQTPLENKTIQTYSLNAKQELKDRLKWIGCGGLLGAMVRGIKLILTKKEAREALRQQMEVPDDAKDNYGFGLYVGRKNI